MALAQSYTSLAGLASVNRVSEPITTSVVDALPDSGTFLAAAVPNVGVFWISL